MIDNVCFTGKTIVRNLIVRYHYSNVMPRITKFCIGGWDGGHLVAGMTLGYGTRPKHTIEGMFPTLSTENYYEVGKLCVADHKPRNTESYFISRAIDLIREEFSPEVKVIFSWADGILGKPGYVYQASNFYYGGYIWTEIYLDENGTKIHPRTVQGLTSGGDGELGPRDFASTRAIGLTKYFGKQFRYVYPLCGKREWKRLQATSPYDWRRGDYPKDKDCTWQVQEAIGERVDCDMPPWNSGDYVKPSKQQKHGQQRMQL